MTIADTDSIAHQVPPTFYTKPHIKRRLLVTLAALAIYRAAENIPLPGVSEKVWNATIEKEGLFAAIFAPREMTEISVMAMGIPFLIFVFAIFELCRLFVPFFGRWLAAAPGRQVRAQVFVAACALVLTAFDIRSVGADLEITSDTAGLPDALVRPAIISVLVGGVALAFGLAKWMDRAGFGLGIWTIAAFVYFPDIVRSITGTISLVQKGNVVSVAIILLAAYLAISVFALVKVDRIQSRRGFALDDVAPGGFWPPFIAANVASLLPIFVTVGLMFDPVSHLAWEPYVILAASVLLTGLFLWRYAMIARANDMTAMAGGILSDWVKCWMVFAAMFAADFVLYRVVGLPLELGPGKLALFVITIISISRRAGR